MKIKISKHKTDESFIENGGGQSVEIHYEWCREQENVNLRDTRRKL
jgi:hypothetical protein